MLSFLHSLLFYISISFWTCNQPEERPRKTIVDISLERQNDEILRISLIPIPYSIPLRPQTKCSECHLKIVFLWTRSISYSCCCVLVSTVNLKENVSKSLTCYSSHCSWSTENILLLGYNMTHICFFCKLRERKKIVQPLMGFSCLFGKCSVAYSHTQANKGNDQFSYLLCTFMMHATHTTHLLCQQDQYPMYAHTHT